jgi:hypothetical protein
LTIRSLDRQSTMLRKRLIAPHSRWGLWNLYGMRMPDRSKAPRSRAVGVALYPVPGRRRSERAGASGITGWYSRHCCVNGGSGS